MRRVIKGRLADKPEVKTYEGKNGKFDVAEFVVYESDPTSAKKGEDGKERWPSMPRRCRAFGDACKEVAQFKKGELMTAVCTIKINEFKTKDGKDARAEYLQIEKIDKENTIDTQLNKLLSAYVKDAVKELDAGIDANFRVEDIVAEADKEVEKALEDDLFLDEGIDFE